MGDLGSIPGLGRSPGEGKGYSLHSGLENPVDVGRKELDMTERPSLSPVAFLSKMYGACGIRSGPVESERNMGVGAGLISHFFL